MCVCVYTQTERHKDVFDRSCVSRLGMRGISCKQFSLQRAPHAGVFEAAAFFFDAHEESLGPARDAPLHRVLIQLGPRGVDSGFHLHFRSWLGLRRAPSALCRPSCADVVVERVEIWIICRESWREHCRAELWGAQLSCITKSMPICAVAIGTLC